ncbi:MAG TPA: carbamoyl phosphate synthase large subunit, partial [bacterium]|nr:carbamoyl phosphate synthase large subunit [bacterium]
RLPPEGTVLITVADRDKQAVVEVARCFASLGFRLLATAGTQAFLAQHGIETERANKLQEDRPHIVDLIKNGEIDLIINTPKGKLSQYDDSYLRKSAIKYRIPYVTTVAAAKAAALSIEARRKGTISIRSLQEYHAAIGQE